MVLGLCGIIVLSVKPYECVLPWFQPLKMHRDLVLPYLEPSTRAKKPIYASRVTKGQK